MIIDTFIDICNKYPIKDCFIYQIKSRNIYKTYYEVLQDVYKMVNLFNNKIKDDEKIVLFSYPNYEFYIAILAALYLKKQIVIIDSFKNKKLLEKMVSIANPKYILVNNKTKNIYKLFKPLRSLLEVNIDKFIMQENDKSLEVKNYNKKILYTFTSATTGIPKLIERSIIDLENQFDLIVKTIEFSDNSIILSLLPIYVLVNIICKQTTYLTNVRHKKIDNFKGIKVNTIEASISKYLSFKKPNTNITNCYTGGSKVTLTDALYIKNIFPNANITYVYGASEAVLMSKTTLDEYIKTLKNNQICAGNIVDNVEIKIINPNSDGVGEIAVSGKTVLSNSLYHLTGDLGKIINNKLYLFGRVKYSDIENHKYSFEIENKVSNNFSKINKICFMHYQEKNYLIYDGNEKAKNIQKFLNDDTIVIKSNKIKFDIRHNYKINYESCIPIILKYKKGDKK